MLITMKDGGLKEYSDDTQCYPGCETCDYGSCKVPSENLHEKPR